MDETIGEVNNVPAVSVVTAEARGSESCPGAIFKPGLAVAEVILEAGDSCC